MIVLDDANLDLAIEGGLWGAFGTTGQRCTATSRIIVQKGVYREFVDRSSPAPRKSKSATASTSPSRWDRPSTKASLRPTSATSRSARKKAQN
jgi:acyl-CoA reductase-like NAD-dependent aldehyde dehydrogenase